MDDTITIEKLKKRIQELEQVESENKRLDAALKECEEKFRLIVENTAETISVLDMNMGFVYVSPTILNLRGFTVKEVINQPLEQIMTPESLNLCMTVFEDELRLEASGTADPDRVRILELQEYKKDGSIIWVEVSLSFLRDKDRKPVGILTLSRDITKRKQTERELWMFRETVGNSSNVIGISNPEGKHIYQNAAFDDLFGSIGDNPASVYVDKTVAEKMFKTIKAGGRWDGELKMVAKDGSVRDIQLRAYANKDSNGSVTALVGIHTDITGRKRAEDERFETLARFSGFSEASQYGMGMADLDGRIIYANPKLARMLGEASPEACLGKHFPTTYYSKAMAGKLNEEVLPSLMRDGHWQGELELIALDGRHISTEENYFVIRDEHGRPLYLADILTDITERKRAEAERVKLEAQFHQAQKMESVGRLAGGVAHDFNNMLSVILGFTELALRKVDPSLPLFADLAEIGKAASRSADLTRQLLAFARKQTIAPKDIDLNETVSGMTNMLRRLVGEDIDLIWKPEPHPWPVMADPSQIDQILANLCVNARDAIHDVGVITIETKNIAIEKAFCADKPGFVPGDYLRLSVSDTGKGMDKKTMGQIFEPFFTTKAMGKGTGLGLATVYGIVKQNNGFIDVESRPGQGTTFTLYLPRHEVMKAGWTEKEGEAWHAAQGHETILLVEDEPGILEMTTQMLEMHGYNVLSAGTPGEAVRLARENAGEIHLLMTDVVMPEMNGRDLAKNLLSLYPDLKRLFMSGYTADVIAHHGVLEEGVQFIQKPFTIKELAAKVREALEG
jgi:PAS domain S-box-containing protein